MSKPNIGSLSEIERLRAENAAMRPIVAMLSACEAVRLPASYGGIDGVLLFHPTVNVLWMREQARSFLGSVIDSTTNAP